MAVAKFFYIYNMRQAQFFINNGLPLLEIGRGYKGDIYHKFLRDERAERVFEMWKNHADGTCEEVKNGKD